MYVRLPVPCVKYRKELHSGTYNLTTLVVIDYQAYIVLHESLQVILAIYCGILNLHLK